MRNLRLLAAAIIVSGIPLTAGAMTRDDVRGGAGARVSVADPDEKLERMAAASTPSDSDRGKPKKSARNVLKADPYLRNAFAWLDNK
ncbi:hypothetical protein [uncultured Sphingomonas sp.]|uniref:hypothetical protein n=1 Tax=uncultured Sphingomonas sp. TaxID=158754 RepID=UPI0035CB4B3C